MVTVDINPPRLLTRETLAAVVFAAAGGYWIYCGNWLTGLLGLFIGLTMDFMDKGIAFDLSRKRYKNYSGLLGLKLGTWEALPAVSGITIKYFSEIVTSGKPGRIRQDKAGHYVLMLSISHSATGLILERFAVDEENYVIMLGEKISAIFNVPLFKSLY